MARAHVFGSLLALLVVLLLVSSSAAQPSRREHVRNRVREAIRRPTPQRPAPQRPAPQRPTPQSLPAHIRNRVRGRPEVAQRVRDAIERNGGREEVAQRVRDAIERNGGREEVAQRVRDAIERNRERLARRDPSEIRSEIRSRVRDSIQRNGGIQEVAQQVKQDPSRLMDRVETRIRRDSRLSEEQQTLVIANLRNLVKEFQNSDAELTREDWRRAKHRIREVYREQVQDAAETNQRRRARTQTAVTETLAAFYDRLREDEIPVKLARAVVGDEKEKIEWMEEQGWDSETILSTLIGDIKEDLSALEDAPPVTAFSGPPQEAEPLELTTTTITTSPGTNLTLVVTQFPTKEDDPDTIPQVYNLRRLLSESANATVSFDNLVPELDQAPDGIILPHPNGTEHNTTSSLK